MMKGDKGMEQGQVNTTPAFPRPFTLSLVFSSFLSLFSVPLCLRVPSSSFLPRYMALPREK